MLVELVVENYAVVERIRIRFHKGLNLMTGETGSGKSIVVDALGLLYGGRASADVVRAGADRARISGIFEASGTKEFRALLEANGIESEDGELLVEREILANGKSRAFLGSRLVTAALLKDLAPHLGDIHGQHDQQELFSSESQRDMIDSYAGIDVSPVAELFANWQRCARELEALEQGEQEKLRLADLWRFQSREIDELSLRPGEDGELESERKVLLNVGRLEEHARAAFDAIYDAPGSAISLLRQARKRLEELDKIDRSLSETLESLKPAEIAMDEAAHALRHYLGGLEADPNKLEEVESRLAAIDKLKRKYGASVSEILEFRQDVAAKLDALENAGERRERLSKERDSLAQQYERAASKLTEARRKSAAQLEEAVQKELASLAMDGTVFRAAFEESEWSASGIDRIKFLMSPNRGEEPRPIEKAASGGELSRLALALKTCVAGKSRASKVMRTLVFDEVDAGVGGRTAESVGRRLKKLAASNQLICVTHLPQIAGFADHHYVVEKHEAKGRTYATIDELTGEARTREIGRMLSGQKMTPEALKHAEQLIKMAGGA